jgi:hypothetical protein
MPLKKIMLFLLHMYVCCDKYILMKTPSHSLRASFVANVEALWPCIKGSLVEVRKPCIRPTCPACRAGRKHPAYLLTYRLNGKTHCRYVPKEWVASLRQAIANGRRLEQRMAELSGELVGQYRHQRAWTERAQREGGKKSSS